MNVYEESVFYKSLNVEDKSQKAFLKDYKPIINEAFDPEIAKIRSLDDFKSMIKKEINSKNLSGIEIPILADQYVRKRFLHGIALLKPCENWSNYLLSKVLYRLFKILGVNEDLNKEYLLWSKTIPEDIMQSNLAICSQQQWVFQAIIKDYKMEYGTVQFNIPQLGHVASSVKVKGTWYYFDPNLEPTYKDKKPPLLKDILAGNAEVLNAIYGTQSESPFNKFSNLSVVPWIEGGKKNLIKFTSLNQHSQPKFQYFQSATNMISNWAWLAFLLISVFIYFQIKDKNINPKISSKTLIYLVIMLTVFRMIVLELW